MAKLRPLGGALVPPPATPAQTAGLIARQEEKYSRLITEKRITFD